MVIDEPRLPGVLAPGGCRAAWIPTEGRQRYAHAVDLMTSHLIRRHYLRGAFAMRDTWT